MSKKEEEFKKRLLATFKVEAGEHLKAISSGLVELETTDDLMRQMQLTEVIFREVHSLKGASRAVDLRDVETLCNTLESIFGKWKQEKKIPPSIVFDKIHPVIDFITDVLSAAEIDEARLEQNITGIMNQLDDLKQKSDINNVEKHKDHSETDKVIPQTSDTERPEKEQGRSSQGEPAQPAVKEHQFIQERRITSETVRISRMKLDTLMMQTEELISVKLKLFQRFSDIQNLRTVLDQFKKEFVKLVRQNHDLQHVSMKQDDGTNKVKFKEGDRQSEEVKEGHRFIKLMDDKLEELIKSTGEDCRSAGRMVDNLLIEMREVLMLPISSILELFPRLVRDLSREHGKKVELSIKGAENELDRRILEELKDPLIHLVRNCIDHGIEKPEDRIKNNKPAAGTIDISISQLPGNKVEIIVSDDGAGIDLSKVREAAVHEGIIPEQEALTNEEAEKLIYHSGITTSPIITDLSGRGLGLAIVREKVDALGGIIAMKSEPLQGTTFCIQIPLTLATYRGIFIRVSGEIFVIPTTAVKRILRINRNEIKMIENRQTIPLNGSTLSYAYLGDLLGLRRKNNSTPGLHGEKDNQENFHALIIGTGEDRIAFGVDEVLNEQEILVKHLAKPVSRVRNIGGVTVLGSGKVIPILNASDMIKSAVSGFTPTEKAVVREKEEAKQRSVMIAEDSITSRMLLKDILESSGFLVKTAVDGAEALSFLREGGYDLLVSDIDMPRMNGFELTEKIRGDKNLKELPVVLVTALKTREDRERGMEVGANAYIEKSTFTPQSLLDVVNRLV
jgi:two-component system chemotaxis sensor kinase CheA